MIPETTLQATESLKLVAAGLGFGLSGACAAVAPPGHHHLTAWIEAGLHAELDYFPARKSAYSHPSAVLDGAVSILMLGMNYCSLEPASSVSDGQGRVSRYAWGNGDYHDLIWSRLDKLGSRAEEIFPGVRWRGVVDTAPLLEREFAALSGLGWQAKNTMLISPTGGSWFFLAALLLDVELAFDKPLATSHCGTCTACLDACPTDAFVAPQVLDAGRCISYLTIELKGQIPHEFRESVGNWVFGCDVCQEVCPWNRFSQPTAQPELQPLDARGLLLEELFELDEAGFRARFRKTALWRPRRRGLLRNAAIVLGNQAQPASVPALVKGMADCEAVVRGASAWALGKIGTIEAQQALHLQLSLETDFDVRVEIRQALKLPE